ncbi:MAG: hypothetical protein WCO11_08300 [Sphingomonadales bacterium]
MSSHATPYRKNHPIEYYNVSIDTPSQTLWEGVFNGRMGLCSDIQAENGKGDQCQILPKDERKNY